MSATATAYSFIVLYYTVPFPWPHGLRCGSTAASGIVGSNPARGMDLCLL